MRYGFRSCKRNLSFFSKKLSFSTVRVISILTLIAGTTTGLIITFACVSKMSLEITKVVLALSVLLVVRSVGVLRMKAVVVVEYEKVEGEWGMA